VRSTTFVFKALCTCIQKKNGVSHFQTRDEPGRAAHRPPRRQHPRHARGFTPPEPHLPRAHAPRGVSFSSHATRRLPPASCTRAERIVGPSAVPHAGRCRRRTMAASSPSSGRHRRERAPYLKSLTPLTRAPSRRRSSHSTASAIDGRSVNLPSAFTPCFSLVQIPSYEPVCDAPGFRPG
jgi:hypothetical protein